MLPKKSPQRMCVGCGQMKDKKTLVRIVCSPDGVLSQDPGGKANGRGAYICRSAECMMRARKSKKLERAFKRQIPADIWDILEEALK